MRCTNLLFAAMAALLFSAVASAQEQAPSPDQAPMILSSLDTDGDKKISESEAQGGLKQNFARIDGNGDGGIDIEELTTMLEIVAVQRGGGSSAAATNDSASDPTPSFSPVFDAPAFDALTKKIEALDTSGKLSKAESMQLYQMMASAIVEEQTRFFSVRQNTVHDYQRHIYGPDTLHVVTALKLGTDAELINTMKEYLRVVEDLGGEVVYIGKSVKNMGLASKQLAESQWDVFAVIQFDGRQQWNELTAKGDYKQMLASFDATYSIGLDRDPLENFRMPANLLSMRIQQSLNNDPKRLPFKRVPDGSPAAKQREQQLTQMVADHEVYSTDAIVNVNFVKYGDSEQADANTSYGNEMSNLYAEGGHGPVHMGKAIKLEGDAEFDLVGLVYYPGLQYFADMVQSTFYTGIYSNKQLGDTLVSITVPILQLLQ